MPKGTGAPIDNRGWPRDTKAYNRACTMKNYIISVELQEPA